MPGIPDTLYYSLRQTLRKCNEFINPEELIAMFNIESLRPWKDSLPSANTLSAYVDVTINYLVDQRRTSGENVLVLFLRALSKNYEPEDDRHGRLVALADQLEWSQKLPPKPPTHSLEANPEQERMIWTVEVETLLQAARSVARIVVPRIRNGRESNRNTGTAWMVAPGLAVTCWHVIEATQKLDLQPITPEELQRQIINAILTFDYTTAGQGIQYRITQVEYPSITSKTLDYAILRLVDRDDFPLSRRGYLRLDLDPVLTTQTILYIIQHPLGQPQQISGDRFERQGRTDELILYRAPTEPGTSGSPVFNRETWNVIALHNGEEESVRLREGTLIKAIMTDLKEHRPDLYGEIITWQQRLWKE